MDGLCVVNVLVDGLCEYQCTGGRTVLVWEYQCTGGRTVLVCEYQCTGGRTVTVYGSINVLVDGLC